MRAFTSLLLSGTFLVSIPAFAQNVPTSPPINFINSTTPGLNQAVPLLLSSYATLMTSNPAVMTQNYQTVITMTQNRTAAQTLNAIHDDRTAQTYSILNGFGALTSYFMTGSGASASGATPQSLTPTTYASFTMADYTNSINYLNSASAGVTNFGNGTATPLNRSITWINNVVRANTSTEPAKRFFNRYQGPVPVIDPLDARYANYNANTNKGGLTTADTAAFVVPSYLANYKVPAPYASTAEWVRGFTVTAAMIAANGGNPITAPNVGAFDSAGRFTPTQFTVGNYVPGIGTAPRPYRVSTDVAVPSLLYPIINSTNAYADGAFPSGHTNSAMLQAIGYAFLVPQQGQELLTRASDLGNNRILSGMHSPLDVMGARIQSTAISATNIYAALYDSAGNRLDWTNPANTSAYATYQAYNETQTYLAAACNAVSVMACINAAQAAGYGATDPFGNAAVNKANYTAQLTYGFSPIGPVAPLTAAQVPLQAQVLLMTRFPYLSDAQRTEILATTGLPSGYPLLSGNTYDDWGQLNLYAAWDGFGAFNSQVAVNMNAALGGYNAADLWANDIGGSGGLTKSGTGQLTLSGRNTYTGPTNINGGVVLVNGSLVSPTTVNNTGTFGGTGSSGSVTVNNGGTLLPGTLTTAGTLTINGNLALNAGSNLSLQVSSAAASQARVSGTATIAPTATATANIAAGTYAPGTRFAVLTTAAGGLSGTFAGLTFTSGGFNANVTPRLSYDAQDVYLTFGQAALPTLATNATGNASRIAAALNAAANNGAVFPTSFQSLYALTPAGLAATLNQLGGQTAGGVRQSADRAMGSFFGSVMDFAAPGRIADGPALGFAPDTPVAPEFANAYAAITKAPMARKAMTYVEPLRWAAWTSMFGGQEKLSGDAVSGSRDLTTRIYGGAGGLDYRLSPDTILGVALSGGESQFSIDNGGDGRSDFVQGGVYGRHAIGNGYVAGSIAGGSHDVRTNRSASIAGITDRLTSSFTAQTVAGRIEGGNRYAYGAAGITPYAAVQSQSVFTPDYTETATPGAGTALTTASQTFTTTRTELGSWVDGRVAMPTGQATLRGRLAWVHNFDPDTSVSASFTALPGANFTISNTPRPADTALVSAAIEVPVARNLIASAKFDGEFGERATTLTGTGTLRYLW